MKYLLAHINQKTVRRLPYASLILTLVAALIHRIHGLRVSLLYEHSALENLELWRFVTCHWVHLNGDHLFWSSATFLALGSICEVLDRQKTYATLAIAVILIPLGIWWGQPDLMVYGGLSGLDCAFYALLMTLLVKRELKSDNRVWALFYVAGLMALLAKVTYESVTGQTIFVANTHSGMVPVPLSHLVGGFIGIMVGFVDNKNGGFRRIFRRIPPIFDSPRGCHSTKVG